MATQTVQRAQHLAALEYANALRLARAQLRKDYAAGRVSLAELMQHPMMQSARIGKVLTWGRHWGPDRARRTLATAGVSELKTIEWLNRVPRQRERLLAVAEGRL